MSTLRVYARGFLTDVVAGGPIKSSTATVREVVGQLQARLVTAFNQLSQTNGLNPSMCSTFIFPAADMDSKIVEVFPGQDEASLFVFIVPPPNFIRSQLQDQIRDIQVEIQDLKRQNVQAQREKEFTQRRNVQAQREMTQMRAEMTQMKAEIDSLRQPHHSLNLRIVLDTAHRKVLDVLYQDPDFFWENLRSQFTDTRSLYEWLCDALPLVDYRPSDQALRLLCQHSNLREAGNGVAHHAGKEELALAISIYVGPNRAELILLFEFAFEERFYLRF